MKTWVQKLMDNLEFDWSKNQSEEPNAKSISEDLATILYMIDNFNKYLFEIEKHPIRKTRESFDEFAKLIVQASEVEKERVLFKFRQFFSGYRIDEVTYIQQTFNDFKNIIWDFVDQLSEEFKSAQSEDSDVKQSFDSLREAVESDSIDALRSQSRQFIDCFIEYQTRKEYDSKKRIHKMKKNLDVVREKLVEANNSMRRDHLTSAFNRLSFDEKINQHWKMFQHEPKALSLITLDIDHFKKVNDTYGHAVGDFVLVECVKVLQSIFDNELQFVARVGGEEFSILLPSCDQREAEALAKKVLEVTRKEVFLLANSEKIQFTVSLGIAELCAEEAIESFIKRADAALYESKESGRNRYTIASRLRVERSA